MHKRIIEGTLPPQSWDYLLTKLASVADSPNTGPTLEDAHAHQSFVQLSPCWGRRVTQAAAITLSKAQSAALKSLLTIGPEKLATVVDAVAAAKVTVRSGELRALFDRLIDGHAQALYQQAIGLANVARRRRSKPKEVLDAFSESITTSSDWDDDERAQWLACKPQLERLIGLPSVTMTAKAIDLSYDYDRVFLDSRVLTDLRPIYSDDKSEVGGITITQTLRIEFFRPTAAEATTFSVSLDEGDLQRLKEICDEALSKHANAKKQFEKLGIQTISPGESE